MITEGRITSHDKVKKAELVLKAKNVLTNPHSKEDYKNRDRLILVCKECETKGRLTYVQLCRGLKKHRVFNSQAYTWGMLQEVFACMGYGSHRDTKTNIINVFKLET